MTAFNPVMHDPEADPITLADFTDGERSGLKRGCRDPMTETEPADHAGREWFAR